jgi:hypothetical protein
MHIVVITFICERMILHEKGVGFLIYILNAGSKPRR